MSSSGRSYWQKKANTGKHEAVKSAVHAAENRIQTLQARCAEEGPSRFAQYGKITKDAKTESLLQKATKVTKGKASISVQTFLCGRAFVLLR
jgi:hypothetical protein